jgi:hypothetical protein
MAMSDISPQKTGLKFNGFPLYFYKFKNTVTICKQNLFNTIQIFQIRPITRFTVSGSSAIIASNIRAARSG